MKPYTRKAMHGGAHGATCPLCCPVGKPIARGSMRRADIDERTLTDGVLVAVYDPDPDLGPDCYYASHEGGFSEDGQPCPCLDCEAVRWCRRGAA